jgi:RND superfamily putative drug exporter
VSGFLYKLGRGCARHPFRVLGAWLVAAIAVVGLQGGLGGKVGQSDTLRIPGVESQRASDILTSRFPSQGGQSARIVFRAGAGRLDDGAHRAILARAAQRLAAGHDVAAVTDPFAAHSAAISADGRTAYVDVAYTVTKLGRAQLDDATAVAVTARAAGVQTEFTGALAQVVQSTPSSELIGIAVAIIVLLVAFGSVVAMGLPILTALMGLFVGATGVGILAAFIDVPKGSLILCVMVGPCCSRGRPSSSRSSASSSPASRHSPRWAPRSRWS